MRWQLPVLYFRCYEIHRPFTQDNSSMNRNSRVIPTDEKAGKGCIYYCYTGRLFFVVISWCWSIFRITRLCAGNPPNNNGVHTQRLSNTEFWWSLFCLLYKFWKCHNHILKITVKVPLHNQILIHPEVSVPKEINAIWEACLLRAPKEKFQTPITIQNWSVFNQSVWDLFL